MTLTEDNSHIQVFAADGILRIGINRPEKKNAIDRSMYSQLVEALEKAEADNGIRVVLIHGTAECFTSGNDLSDFTDVPLANEQSPVFKFLEAIHQISKPLVAAVNGPAVGIGTTMLLHCDLVYAGEQSLFQTPFVNLGLCPEAGSTFLLPMLCGHQRAAEILLLGQPFSADKAHEIGLVNEVFRGRTVFQNAMAQAQLLAKQPPEAVCLTKRLMKLNVHEHVTRVMSEEGGHFLARLQSKETVEAINNFLQKRPDVLEQSA